MRKLYSVIFVIFFCISGCTKIENTTIGSGLIPPIDGVNTIDTTLDVITNTFLDPLGDSALVYKTEDHVIGVVNDDPLFGKTSAKAFFELKPTVFKFSLPNAPSVVADSAVLILSYKGIFGDSIQNQNWEVREITEAMRPDTVYNTSKSFSTGALLGSKNIFIPLLNDSVNNRFENASNQIRIKLSAAFANRIMKQYDSLPGHPYESDSLFRESFKGFAVMPAAGSGGNALIHVNLADTNTKLALFYNYQIKDSAAGKRDTAVSYFRFNTGSGSGPICGNANFIKRERSGSQLMQYFNNTNRNDSLVFIQATPGTFATIKIPKLTGFPNVLVHRAELLTFQEPDLAAATLTAPRFLLLSSYDSTGRIKTNVPHDFVISSGIPNITTFGGYVEDKAVAPLGAIKAYTFDVSRYVQGIVSRKEPNLTLRLSAPVNDSVRYTPPYPNNTVSNTFYVVPTNANSLADGRVRLGGGGMSAGNPVRMRLRIIFSRI